MTNDTNDTNTTSLSREKVKLNIELTQPEFDTMTALMEKLDIGATDLVKRCILLEEFIEDHIDRGSKFYVREEGQVERRIMFE